MSLDHEPLPSDTARRELLRQPLAEALGRGEFRLVYQPQVCLTRGEIIGAEALLRWRHPELGEVSPAEFVPLAEEEGLIAKIGSWVLETACEQAARWRQEGLPELRVGVNVSPRQFEGDDFAARVRRALARSKLPATALGLEVTEGTLLRDVERVVQALRELQAEGVEISLDDFGTGYSSLSRLRELPIDIVKIDKSFVHDVLEAPSRASVTRSVIHLAHGLHLRVLAEGVETEEQVKRLVAQGCDRLQGWYFGRATEPEALAELLRSGRHLPRELTHRAEHQRTLLLVDDEAHILSALKRLFRRDGYRILTATSGSEALETMATERVDVIVSDQRMPGMTGVEFLRRAKDLHPDSIRITLSGYTDLQSIIDAVNEGAVYKFLTKPWDDERLREHVALAFRQRDLAEENARLNMEITRANTELGELNRRLEASLARHEVLAQALQSAAGGARDTVDLLPTAVFGIDAEGMLAYANRHAAESLPGWAAALGGDVDAEMQALLQRLRALSSDEAARDGVATQIHGKAYLAWLRTLRGPQEPRGDLLVLQPCAPCRLESAIDCEP